MGGKKQLSIKLLKIALVASALAPLVTGFIGLAGIDNPLYTGHSRLAGVLLDSNLRLLNGFSVGVGICTLWIVPSVTRRTSELRMICLIVFLGAVGRVLSIVAYGLPPLPYSLFAFIELGTPPLLVLWQSRLAVAPDLRKQTKTEA